MNSLILIPARKGSQRVANKNLFKVKNKPLIFWTIKYAKKISKLLNFDVCISSDCKNIKKIAVKEKIKFIMRPKKYSDAKAKMESVINHTLELEDKNFLYEFIILLQPTSPIRSFDMVSSGIKILRKYKNFNSLIHLKKLELFTGKRSKNGRWHPYSPPGTRSQDILNLYEPSGCLFIYRRNIFRKNKKNFLKSYGMISKLKNSVNIDNYEDFNTLNYYLKNSRFF